MPMKNPPHPGDFIRTEIVEPAGLTVTATAAALGVSRPTLSSLLNGKAGLSGEMALRIEKAFGVKMDTLMRMQSAYEIAQTRKRENLIRVQPVRRAAELSFHPRFMIQELGYREGRITPRTNGTKPSAKRICGNIASTSGLPIWSTRAGEDHLPAQNGTGERFLDIALVELKGAILALVYTIRNGNVRFISFRYASRKERRRYAAAKS